MASCLERARRRAGTPRASLRGGASTRLAVCARENRRGLSPRLSGPGRPPALAASGNLPDMNIAFFGSSLLSAYWNGAATYYRGIIRALHERGHRVTFYEPDAYDRQQHRDLAPPPWARVVVYPNDRGAALRQVEAARGADLIV